MPHVFSASSSASKAVFLRIASVSPSFGIVLEFQAEFYEPRRESYALGPVRWSALSPCPLPA